MIKVTKMVAVYTELHIIQPSMVITVLRDRQKVIFLCYNNNWSTIKMSYYLWLSFGGLCLSHLFIQFKLINAGGIHFYIEFENKDLIE